MINEEKRKLATAKGQTDSKHWSRLYTANKKMLTYWTGRRNR